MSQVTLLKTVASGVIVGGAFSNIARAKAYAEALESAENGRLLKWSEENGIIHGCYYDGVYRYYLFQLDYDPTYVHVVGVKEFPDELEPST